VKLMKRHVPVHVLDLIVNLLSGCLACIKWDNGFSACFNINFGVRQGSVLSPVLFAVYLDDLAQ